MAAQPACRNERFTRWRPHAAQWSPLVTRAPRTPKPGENDKTVDPGIALKRFTAIFCGNMYAQETIAATAGIPTNQPITKTAEAPRSQGLIENVRR
jgi:hypothetical protein